MIRTCRGGSRAVLRQKIRTRNTTPRGREHAGDDDGAGDQQRVARRDAARRPRNRPWRRRRPERRRLRCTEGLLDEFPDRVFDTPLAEGGVIGTAIGMALYGLRPVPE